MTGIAIRDGDARRPAWPPSTTGRSSDATPDIAGDRPVPALPETASGTRTTLAKRKNARPNIRKTSPTEATFWIGGMGIGMTSASGPRWSRKLASRVAGRIVWIVVETSAVVKPAATRLGSQIGM